MLASAQLTMTLTNIMLSAKVQNKLRIIILCFPVGCLSFTHTESEGPKNISSSGCP